MKWVQNQCHGKYQLLVVEEDACTDDEHCFELFEHDIFDGEVHGSSRSVSISSENLESCTHYRALVRSKGINISSQLKSFC